MVKSGMSFFKKTAVLLVASGIAAFLSAGAQPQPLRVVCTTTALEAVIDAVGRNMVEVTSLIPEQSCPGHCDITPSLSRKLGQADLVCCHDFEARSFVDKLIRMSGNADLEVKRIAVPGSWMVPDVQIKAAEQVCSLLSKARPQQAALFEHNTREYNKQVGLESLRVRRRLEALGLRGCPVVASAMQEEFLRRMGFVVVATYVREGDVSARSFRKVIDASRGRGVLFVVDNLQSGPKIGAPIAAELGAKHVVFSNFPLTFDKKVSYLRTLQGNLKPITQE
jgi:ABC-type Zn uptake system ZnuABC Zn-binding protein ZnuA